MRFVQFDYHPPAEGEGVMASWWSHHWESRDGLKRDLRDEPLWPTIHDVLGKPGKLLEAGCGPGQWVQFFDSIGHTTVGLDYAWSGLRVAKSANGALRVMRGDFRGLPFPTGSFDYIYSNGAVEHDPRGPAVALREFHRVLKPSGWLMCSVPCLNVQETLLMPWHNLRDWLKGQEWLRRIAGKTDPFEFYQYVYSPWTYRAFLVAAGFEVVDLRPYGTPVPGAAKRLLQRVSRALGDFYDPHMMMAICRPRR